eukprot:3596531-Pleurochrysis_carterae.AAC.1
MVDEGEDKAVQREYDKEMKAHSDSHLDQLKYQPPIIHAGTDIFIVDPLHCLELNCAKVAWKYSFSDKMDDASRERATEYMEAIGCTFDMRVKGKRNPEEKSMSGATVDDYTSWASNATS